MQCFLWKLECLPDCSVTVTQLRKLCSGFGLRYKRSYYYLPCSNKFCKHDGPYIESRLFFEIFLATLELLMFLKSFSGELWSPQWESQGWTQNKFSSQFSYFANNKLFPVSSGSCSVALLNLLLSLCSAQNDYSFRSTLLETQYALRAELTNIASVLFFTKEIYSLHIECIWKTKSKLIYLVSTFKIHKHLWKECYL